MPHFSKIRWSFFRISPRYYSSQFSQVIVLFHFSRKSQNKKFLEFFQLFAAFIEIEKCRLFFAFLRLACLIDSCQEKARNSNQDRFICYCSSVAVKMANCVKIKMNEKVMRLRSSTLTVGNLAMIYFQTRYKPRHLHLL